MNQQLAQSCASCGNEFYEWACDYCYGKSVMRKIGEEKIAQIR
ncbi:hypothetical protein [Nitrosopumilus sp. S4]